MRTKSEEVKIPTNCTFDVGTDPDMAQVNVQNRVSQIESKLPQEVRMVGAKSFHFAIAT